VFDQIRLQIAISAILDNHHQFSYTSGLIGSCII
jgi:hypothetical protein